MAAVRGGWKNQLYFGDNLGVLREHVPDESVDLVYLDPPFNSNATYNVLFKEHSGERSGAQIAAFDDTWQWGLEAESTYRETVEHGGKLAELLQAFRAFLGQSDMMAYLTMMAPRLQELCRVLRPTGSIYLHCDPTASHYLKLIMDAVFGPANFRNEIVWKRANAHNDPKRYGRVSDSILFFTKTDKYKWETQHTKYREEYYESHFKKDSDGRYFRTVPLDAPRHGAGSPGLLYPWKGKLPAASRTWAVKRGVMEQYERDGLLRYTRTGTPTLLQYADAMPGVPLQNIWVDIPPVNPQAHERLGYPTQKPEALLERIIRSSSNDGDIILDPFCGCGTTISVAEHLHRRWVGIDVTHLAISLIKRRLHDTFKKDLAPYQTFGEPTDLESARVLAEHDRFEFQKWALGLVDASAREDSKKGADAGVDGRIYFFDDESGIAKKVILSVKSGGVQVRDIRDLKAVIARDKAVIGVFITLESPSKPMLKEAIGAGFYAPKDFPKLKVPVIQILTIEEALAGKKVDWPRVAVEGTFKVAVAKQKVDTGKPKRLL